MKVKESGAATVFCFKPSIENGSITLPPNRHRKWDDNSNGVMAWEPDLHTDFYFFSQDEFLNGMWRSLRCPGSGFFWEDFFFRTLSIGLLWR